MAEEATEEAVMAEVVDSHMDNSMEEVVDSSMAEVVDSHMDINMGEVVDNHMDNNMEGVVDSSTLYHPRHIWQQLQSQLPVPLRDNQRKKDRMKQPLGTLLTMSTKMKERESSRKIGTATRHRGLWHIDHDKMGHDASSVFVAIVGGKESMALVHHCRMGHMAFDKMFRVFPDVMNGVDKIKLCCDACEYAKHTRTSYVSRGIRSVSPFVLVHSDVWMCPVVSVSGMKYFVTFIDCYSRMTWIYLMRHKDEVFTCFQSFCAYVKNQFNVQVQVIRTDNGTEYINKPFADFLSSQGILHQTSCPGTPPQNGVAERKNRHILEVARSLMFTMNVPKFLWSEAVMTATYLINENAFKDSRQKGYKCWSPTDRRTFVSMDVTFRESEPFYDGESDLSGLFQGLDHLGDAQEGEQQPGGDQEQQDGDQYQHQQIPLVAEIPAIPGTPTPPRPVPPQRWLQNPLVTLEDMYKGSK
nr:uncharacterized protein LOC127328621 [Lolium perenne]